MESGHPVCFLGSHKKLLFLLVSRPEIQFSHGIPPCAYVTSKFWRSAISQVCVAYFDLAFPLLSIHQSYAGSPAQPRLWRQKSHLLRGSVAGIGPHFLLGSGSSQHNSTMMAAFHSDLGLSSLAYYCFSCGLSFGKSWASSCVKHDLTFISCLVLCLSCSMAFLNLRI